MIEKKAVFVDRDGVINKKIARDGGFFSPRSFKDFRLKKGIKKFLREARRLGFLVIVVTNQPDIARKLLNPRELEKMHSFLYQNLPLDDLFVCPHDDSDNCSCRKPKPGMLKKAAQKWHINLKKSFIVGDSWKDIEAGKRAGCRTILFQKKNTEKIGADFNAGSFEQILKIIKNS